MENIEVQAHEKWLRDQIHCVPLSKVAAGNIKPPPPLFNGFLLHKTVTMLSAEPFSGKTLLMLAMAISLNTGRPLFGRHEPAELRRVLFIGQDAPTWDYIRQAQKLLRGYGITEYGNLETDLILNENIRITDQRFDSWLKEWHDAVGFDVLMLDTLISVHGADENDNRQMSAIMGILKRIRDLYGCTVLFSHHTSKPQQGDSPISANYRARGATAIAAGVDFHFQLIASGGGQVNLAMPKSRGADGMDPPPYFNIVQTGFTEDELAISFEAPNEDTRRGRFINLLKEPRNRKELIHFLLLAEPNLGKDRAEKWVDNELQALRRSGAAESTARGTWMLRGGV